MVAFANFAAANFLLHLQVLSGTFVTTPFTNLKKAGSTKGKLKYHRDSAAHVQAFISTFQKLETSIQHSVLKQARMQYELNVKILSSVVRAVLFCGRQNIALQGHHDRLLSIVVIFLLFFIY